MLRFSEAENVYNAGVKTTCSIAIEKSEAKAILIF
jgi:hypothetical protein